MLLIVRGKSVGSRQIDPTAVADLVYAADATDAAEVVNALWVKKSKIEANCTAPIACVPLKSFTRKFAHSFAL